MGPRVEVHLDVVVLALGLLLRLLQPLDEGLRLLVDLGRRLFRHVLLGDLKVEKSLKFILFQKVYEKDISTVDFKKFRLSKKSSVGMD